MNVYGISDVQSYVNSASQQDLLFVVRQAHHERILIIPFNLSLSKGALNYVANLRNGTLIQGFDRTELKGLRNHFQGGRGLRGIIYEVNTSAAGRDSASCLSNWRVRAV